MYSLGPLRLVLSVAVIGLIMPFPGSDAGAQSNPCLQAGPDALHFYRNACADSAEWQGPDSQYVTVSNCGDGTLQWTMSSSETWVSFEPTTGGNFDSVLVYVNPENLPPTPDMEPGDTASFEAILTVEDPYAENSPQYVTIILRLHCVTEDYTLAVSPSSFNYFAGQNQTLTGVFHVWEVHGANIQFDLSNSSNWLFLPVYFVPPVTPDSVPFTIVTNSLQPGTYHDSIVVYPLAEGWDSPTYIPVTLAVSDSGYTLAVSPSAFDYTLGQNQTLTGIFHVYELNGANIEFDLSNSSNWLFLPDFLVPPVTPDSVQFIIVTDSLQPGAYHDSIVVYGPPDAWNSPAYIPVTLTVTDETQDYVVVTAPQYFDLTLAPGETRYDSLHVYEVEGNLVQFTFWNREPWLQLAPYPDSLPPYYTPRTLSVLTDASSLAPGSYVDTIFIYPDSMSFQPVNVPVFLTVEGQPTVSVNVAPDSFEIVLPTGGYVANLSVLVYEESGGVVPFIAGTSQQSSWLILQDTVNPYHWTPDSLHFSINATSLVPGVYIDSIAVSEVPNEIIRFDNAYATVTLTVTGDSAEFVVETVPTSFEVTLSYGEFALDSLFVYEVLGRQVPFVFDNNEYWVVVNPLGMSPYFTPEMLTVIIDSDTLSAGVHTDSIWVYPSSRAMGFVPVSVPVTMTIVSGYSCGDTDGSGEIDIDDVVEMINYVFSGTVTHLPLETGDVDCSGMVDIDDIVFLVSYVLVGGDMPCADCR